MSADAIQRPSMWVRMSDEWKPTGVWDALLIELLLGLSMPPEAVMAMSAQERIETLQQAAADGRLSPDQTARLTLAGLLPADDEPVSGE